MPCPSCGSDGPDGARFCPSCGAKFAADGPMTGARKTVTVVFCDLAESTALSERLDPERLRAILLRYYDLMAECLHRHQGVVEKFIGDAVVAVFGVPAVHEDDALRAVRAASEMSAAVADLNDELAREVDVRVAIRVGVNTGEVFTSGDPDAGHVLTSGEAVNVAARLQQHAGTGEILIGPETHRLVAPFAVVEPVGALAVKGKSAPIRAWRLVTVDPDASGLARRFDGPMVGRGDEMLRLTLTMHQLTRDRSCHLVTVFGDAGAGKSRLAREFRAVATEREALVGTGRCRPYGESATLQALAEAVEELLAAAGSALAGEAGEALATLRRGLLRDGTPGAPAEETYWALGHLMELLARERPVLLVVDDLHWAAPPLLDVLDHLAEWTNAPVMLLCLARLDLLDQRPNWGSVKVNAMSFVLCPLDGTESEQLVAELVDVVPHAADVADRIVARAEGNPLFLEHLVEMVREGGDADSLPPTLQMLLASRLDRLTAAERRTLECATIVGRQFTLAELGAVCGESADHLSALRSLSRKRLVVPAPGGAFRFASVLVQEVAYASMPKRIRSELHERFADRCGLDGAPPAVTGGHLERAFQHMADLGSLDLRGRRLRERAAHHLALAGSERLGRGDLAWSENLLERALALHDETSPARLGVAAQLAEARITMGQGRAGPDTLRALHDEVLAAGDARLAAHIRLTLTYLDPLGGRFAESVQAARDALPLFEAARDHLGLARAWLRIGQERQGQGRYGEAAETLEHALEHAEQAGAELDLASILGALAISLWLGPEPVPTAVDRCRALLARHGAGRRVVVAAVSCPLAALLAARGEFDEARALAADAERVAVDLGHAFAVATMPIFGAEIEALAGRPDVAEKLLRRAVSECERLGDRQLAAAAARELARVLLDQGRHDDAHEVVDAPAFRSGDALASSLAQRCAISARLLAAQGVRVRAQLLADLAVAVAEHTDSPAAQARVLLDSARVAHQLGQPSHARAAAAVARDRFAAKGHLRGVAAVDEFGAEVGG